MSQQESVGTLEKIGTSVDFLRVWMKKTWRIGMLMAKGAYIVGERRRLFVQLGEEVYKRISRGELKDPQLEPLVQQLERLTKKVELEEVLIRNIRFGNRAARMARSGARASKKAT